MATPTQCYLPATRCFGTGSDTVYILQKVATRMQATPFYFDYQNTCYSVNPTTTAVQPGAGVSYVTGSPSGPYSTCTNCSSGCYLAPPDISFCPGTAGSQTINATMATPNGAWSASVTCSVSADVTVSPSSGTSDSSGNFSFTVNYSGADSNTQTCTVNVAMAGCSNGAVDVDISPVPSTCPSGLANTYTVEGGPVTIASGGYQVVSCQTCNISSPTFDGTLHLVPNDGLCYSPPYPPGQYCIWAADPNCGGVGQACWDGYAMQSVQMATGVAPNAAELVLYQGTWTLTFGLLTGLVGIPCNTGSYNSATYTKSCGSTPKGIYTATDPTIVPQTLRVR